MISVKIVHCLTTTNTTKHKNSQYLWNIWNYTVNHFSYAFLACCIQLFKVVYIVLYCYDLFLVVFILFMYCLQYIKRIKETTKYGLCAYFCGHTIYWLVGGLRRTYISGCHQYRAIKWQHFVWDLQTGHAWCMFAKLVGSPGLVVPEIKEG